MLAYSVPLLRSPGAVGVGDRPQHRAVEAVVAAQVGEIVVDRALGQSHRLAQLALRSSPGAPSAAIASRARAQCIR